MRLARLFDPGGAPSEHLAAIDGDGLAGDPAGEPRAQKQCDLRHLLRLAQPAEWDASEDAAIKVGVVEPRPLPGAAGKLDRAWYDAIDPDALRASAAASVRV